MTISWLAFSVRLATRIAAQRAAPVEKQDAQTFLFGKTATVGDRSF